MRPGTLTWIINLSRRCWAGQPLPHRRPRRPQRLPDGAQRPPHVLALGQQPLPHVNRQVEQGTTVGPEYARATGVVEREGVPGDPEPWRSCLPVGAEVEGEEGAGGRGRGGVTGWPDWSRLPGWFHPAYARIPGAKSPLSVPGILSCILSCRSPHRPPDLHPFPHA